LNRHLNRHTIANSEMHRFGYRQASNRLWRRLFVGQCVVALALGLGCATGIAEPARQLSTAPVEDFCALRGPGRLIRADPSNYRILVAKLAAGDTLLLKPGVYRRLVIANLNGAPGRCITISGPATGPRVVIVGEAGSNTIELIDSRYVVVSNLTIDSLGILGANGIKAPLTPHPATHHIVLDKNVIVGAGATQQNDGISTKTPTWNWVIRRNTIIAAGTALYLGDADGSEPFVAGIIENNLVLDPVGYCMEIKYQRDRPVLAGMPEGPQSTIIRNNVFIKDDRPSPDGNRPNLLVGGFPDAGAGSQDLYQIYGNLFFHNSREALFQGSGRISFHDNILVDGQYAAAVFRDHDLPLRLAHVYNNTIYSSRIGIEVGSPAREGVTILGNLVFASPPISGVGAVEKDNLVASPAEASQYVKRPAFELGVMDFFPLPGKVSGVSLDLSSFAAELDFDRDFNGSSKGNRTFHGAYAGDGTNPGWRLRAQIKPEN
jgi:hypothetical protein